jgi:N12 class adenine-specific DNA methylase
MVDARRCTDEEKKNVTTVGEERAQQKTHKLKDVVGGTILDQYTYWYADGLRQLWKMEYMNGCRGLRE